MIRYEISSNGYLAVPPDIAMTAKIIELGGGAAPQWHPNVDVRYCHDEQGRPTVDFTADFDKPLPIQSDEWDVVFSRYAIEHLSWRNVTTFIAEVYRILKPSGVAVIITANAEAQMKWALKQKQWDWKISQCLAGDQDYSDNTHKVFFNPNWISKLFREAGFSSVLVSPHGELLTDMTVEALK